jgi:2-C-methyl-D-erythritol 4-phosphate cytidylyltransferase
MKNKYAIIVAGGSGSRMKSDLPKQYLLLNHKPILMHTIEKFIQAFQDIKIILVLPADQAEYWQSLCQLHQFDSSSISLAKGGSSRFYSVKNGLAAIQDEDGLVAIHDGVRPLVNTAIIKESYRVAQEKGNAVVCVAPKDSMRMVEENSNYMIDRAKVRLIQTPQTFDLKTLKKAFDSISTDTGFTDDASVLEHMGYPIQLIAGSYENIKITTPEDLILAEALLKK